MADYRYWVQREDGEEIWGEFTHLLAGSWDEAVEKAWDLHDEDRLDGDYEDDELPTYLVRKAELVQTLLVPPPGTKGAPDG